MNIEREDRIRWYYSRAANREYPVYAFGGDTDMATQGKVSLASVRKKEVVIVDASKVMENEQTEPTAFEAGINAMLGRSDLRLPRHREIPGTHGLYESLDIHDPSKAVECCRVQSIAAFLRRGGRIRGVGERVTGLAGENAFTARRALFLAISLGPMALGYITAVRFGMLLRQGKDKYGWDFANATPRFDYRSVAGWTDNLTLLAHMLFFGLCMGIVYCILRLESGQGRILKLPELVLFYAGLAYSILAIVISAQLL